MNPFVVFVVLAFVVFVVAIWGFLHHMKMEKARAEAARSVARRLGCRYEETDRFDRPRDLVGFEPFGQGEDRYCRNVLSGEGPGGAFEAFEYHYLVRRTHHTKNGTRTSTTHHWSQVHRLAMPIASPGLVIRDEHIGHKLFDMVGGEDIDFESDAFSRRFWVRAEDRRFAYDVIHTGMMEHLLPTKGWVWQWRGEWLVVYRTGRMDPKRLEADIAFVAGFRARLPRHLLVAQVV